MSLVLASLTELFCWQLAKSLEDCWLFCVYMQLKRQGCSGVLILRQRPRCQSLLRLC